MVRPAVFAALGLLLTGCGSATATAPPGARVTATAVPQTPTSSPTDPTPTTSVSRTTQASPTATAKGTTVKVRKGDIASFASPTKNIECIAIAGGGDAAEYVRCTISGQAWKPPKKPAGCTLDFGTDVQVSVDGASFVCAGDTVRNPRAKVLGDGDTVQAGKIACSVSQTGLRCLDANSDHGFELGKERYKLF
ncbi:MAG TPA: DUF6636 domain-containing protein [Dermatophilaceae bacterium]|nr:DUF6636 domain-containing protein [Dermatophilaceae bacterium]